MNFYKKKPFWILIVFAILVLFDYSMPRINLTDRAIVVAISLDVGSKEGSYLMGAQIIKSAKGSPDNKASGFAVIEGEGATMAAALEEVEKKSGLVLSLAHCNIFAVSKAILDSGDLPDIFYLVFNYHLPHETLIVATEVPPLKLLAAHIALADNSSASLHQILEVNGNYVETLSTTVKDFCMFIEMYGMTAAIPKINLEVLDREDIDYNLTESEIPLIQLTVDNGYLFKKGEGVTEMDTIQTRAVNYFFRVKRGILEIEHDEKLISLEILDLKGSIKYSYKDNKPKADASVKVRVSLNEVLNKEGDRLAMACDNQLLKQYEKLAAQLIEEEITRSYKFFAEENLDVYNVYEGLYSKGGAKWSNAAGEDYLKQTEFTVKTKAHIVRT